MDTLDPVARAALGGAGHQQQRCAKCKRFARLWPGESECDRCNGALALVYVPRPGEQR